MYAKIINVIPKEDFVLIVDFDNNVTKKIDMHNKLSEARFRMLNNTSFFRTVKIDAGGYGISWNDEIDMSEYELWEDGEVYNCK